MEKCTFCVQRIRGAQNRARLEDRNVQDGDITPSCAQACPSEAIVFGDLHDRTSRVAALAQDPRGYHVLEGLNRSEERRVGKECRSGWAPYDVKKEMRV